VPKALKHQKIISVDVSAEKRDAALKAARTRWWTAAATARL
jgi:hypothetical protein